MQKDKDKDKGRSRKLSLHNDCRPELKNDHHHHNNEHGNEPVENEISKNSLIKKLFYMSKAGKGEDGFTKTNQDSYLVIENINNLENFNIFGVLDGHGLKGDEVSSFVVKYFKKSFKNNQKIKGMKTEEEIYQYLKKNNYEYIHSIFNDAERQLKLSSIDVNFSGTTCVMVIQLGRHLMCCNVGDSRCILVTKENKVVELSIDQKPNNPKEKKRIMQNGGEVSQYEEDGYPAGPFRVWKKNEMYPGIAMSRSIGDLIASSLGVIPEPEIIEKDITDNSKFIVICSDGVWEFLSNEKVMETVNKYYDKQDPKSACEHLIKDSTNWWEQEDVVVDDITTIILFF